MASITLTPRGAGWSAICAIAMAIGCGSSGSGPRKPDTGYGAAQSVPATVNCNDFCQRLASCAADLCDEDSMSTRYEALAEVLLQPCDASCTDALLQSKISSTQWQCLFSSSCREAVDASYDACNVMASYSCN
jgi:hypothetical protein